MKFFDVDYDIKYTYCYTIVGWDWAIGTRGYGLRNMLVLVERFMEWKI